MTTTPTEELRQTIQSVLNEYVDCYKIGFDHARGGKEKDWSVVQKLADKHTDVVMSRIHKALAVRQLEARIDEVEHTVCKDNSFNYQEGSWEGISKRARLEQLKSQLNNSQKGEK